MSEMVDRVKEAILDCDIALTNDEARTYAIAAIKAMREPTKEMVDAAYGEITSRIESDGSDLFEAWRAAIDAALPTPEKDKDDGR